MWKNYSHCLHSLIKSRSFCTLPSVFFKFLSSPSFVKSRRLGVHLLDINYLDSWSNESSRRNLAETPANFAGCRLLYTVQPWLPPIFVSISTLGGYYNASLLVRKKGNKLKRTNENEWIKLRLTTDHLRHPWPHSCLWNWWRYHSLWLLHRSWCKHLLLLWCHELHRMTKHSLVCRRLIYASSDWWLPHKGWYGVLHWELLCKIIGCWQQLWQEPIINSQTTHLFKTNLGYLSNIKLREPTIKVLEDKSNCTWLKWGFSNLNLSLWASKQNIM